MRHLRILLFVLCIVALAVNAQAQSPAHKVTLSWTASPDASTEPTLFYNVYRASGPCPASGSPQLAAKIGSTLAAVTTYIDSSVSTTKTYCYFVRSALNLVESDRDSNSAQAVIPLAPPSGLVAPAQ